MRWMPGATSMTARMLSVAAAAMIERWPWRASPPPARRAPLSDLLIVDADVHVHESPGALAPYCDGPWDVALRNVADVPERYLDIPGFSPGGDGTLTARFPTSHEAARMVHTPEQMVAELREIHVDLAVLFPDHLLKLPVLPQADYAAALARAYNAWLVDQWTSRHDALLGAIVACPHDPTTPPARSSATPTTRRSSRSTCRARGSTRCGATAATTRSSTPRRTRACPSCCTR